MFLAGINEVQGKSDKLDSSIKIFTDFFIFELAVIAAIRLIIRNIEYWKKCFFFIFAES